MAQSARKHKFPVEEKSFTFSAPAAFQANQFEKGQKRTAMKYLTFRPARLKTPATGKWFIEFYVRHPHTGEFHRFKKYGLGEGGGLNRIPNEEEKLRTGIEWAASWNLALESGWIPPDFEEPKLEAIQNYTVLQALNLFRINLENKAARKKTWQAYATVLNYFINSSPKIGCFPKLHKSVRLVTRVDVESFLLKIKAERDLNNTTYNTYLRYIKTFFNYCVDMGYLEESPVYKSKWLKEEIKSHRFFTDDQWNKIKKHASPELLEFMEFLYNTGVRPTDARLAQWKQLYGDKFRVNAETTKTDRDRFVPLSAAYAAKLNERRGPDNDYIFGGKEPKGMNHYGSKFTVLRKLLQMDDGYTLYGTKHTRIVHLALQGADPYDIMNFIGHTSLETTMKYLRNLGLAINRRVVEKYNEF